ncbi:hypothetical protein PILCRDRAFT_311386 [Piloderma croceum F 1598]|uniref:Uncharacterized protein n=1 Tax=Piloderma croceum (strain F 1598) TaxID=765440 RepID=A0A0C3G4E3_PILCF|nr:hypothetical protein PILCRDRAFT_311386 [Piloderma croceum F 1598]
MRISIGRFQKRIKNARSGYLSFLPSSCQHDLNSACNMVQNAVTSSSSCYQTTRSDTSVSTTYHNNDLMPARPSRIPCEWHKSSYRRVPVDRFKLAKLVLSSVALVGFSDI